MLTPEGERAAQIEAKEWGDFLEWFDVLYKHSFDKFKYTKASALQIYLLANCVAPRGGPFDSEGDADEEQWKKS